MEKDGSIYWAGRWHAQGPALAGTLHGTALSIFPQSWKEGPAAVLKNNKS